jgi:hypothetical protein
LSTKTSSQPSRELGRSVDVAQRLSSKN